MHLSAEEIEQYAKSPAEEMPTGHFAECPFCREEVLLARLLLLEERSQSNKAGAAFLEKMNHRLNGIQQFGQSKRRVLHFSKSSAAWVSIAALAMVGVMVGFFTFHTSTPAAGFVRVTGVVGTVLKNGVPLKGGTAMGLDGELETLADGYAIVEFGSIASVLLEPDTKIKLAKILAGKATSIHLALKGGATFSRVKAGQADYRILAGGYDFKVLGTAFSVQTFVPGNAVLQVLHGTVGVQDASGELSVPGEFVTACSDLRCDSTKRVSTPVSMRLSELDGIRNQEQLQVLATKDRHRAWSLEEIKKKYGRLSIIETTAGKKIRGGFIAQNGRLFIQTTTEKIELPGDAIRKIIPSDNAK